MKLESDTTQNKLPSYRYELEHIYTDDEADIQAHKIHIYRDEQKVNWEYMVGNFTETQVKEYASYLVSCDYRKLPVRWQLY